MHPAARRSAGTRAGLRAGTARAQDKGAAPSDRRRRRRRRLRGAGRRRRAAGARAGSCAAFWRSIYNAAAPVQSRRLGSRRVLASTALAAEGHHVISGVGADAASLPARWHTRVLRQGRRGLLAGVHSGGGGPGRDGMTEPSEVAEARRSRGRGSWPRRGAPWGSEQGASRPVPAPPPLSAGLGALGWGRAAGTRSARPSLWPPGAVTEASPYLSPSPAPLSESRARPGPLGRGRRGFLAGAPGNLSAGSRSEPALMPTSLAACCVLAHRGDPQLPGSPLTARGMWGPQDPSRPGPRPRPPRPAHAPHYLGAGAGGALSASSRFLPIPANPTCRRRRPGTWMGRWGGGERTGLSQTLPPALLESSPLQLCTSFPTSPPIPRG